MPCLLNYMSGLLFELMHTCRHDVISGGVRRGEAGSLKRLNDDLRVDEIVALCAHREVVRAEGKAFLYKIFRATYIAQL